MYKVLPGADFPLLRVDGRFAAAASVGDAEGNAVDGAETQLVERVEDGRSADVPKFDGTVVSGGNDVAAAIDDADVVDGAAVAGHGGGAGAGLGRPDLEAEIGAAGEDDGAGREEAGHVYRVDVT